MRPPRRFGGWGAALVLASAFAALIAATLLRLHPAGALAAAADAPPSPARAREPTPFAPSLAGTSTDGIAASSRGDALALEPGLIALFDHYLATLGERSIGEIRAALEGELAHRYAPAAAAQAQDVLARYLAFRQALRDAEPGRPKSAHGADLLRERLRTLHAIRAGYFTEAESRALFGPADREAADAIARMAVAEDPALDAEAKRRRLAALEAQAPADVRAARAATLSVVRLDEAARQLRASGGSDDDVWHLRAAAASPEAANRLADLDREEAAWQGRIADYLAQRGQLLSAGDGDAGRQVALDALRHRLFTPAEQRRLAAYER